MGTEQPEHRLLIGVGGTGKSTTLRTWADDKPDRKIRWITGNPKRYASATKVDNFCSEDPEILILDELQWFTDEALEALAERVEGSTTPTIWASRRPWPNGESVEYLSSLLTRTNAPTVAGLLQPESLRATVAQLLDGPVKAELIDWLYEQTSGSTGLCADILSSDWHHSPEADMPQEVAYLISQRVGRCEPAAQSLLRTMAFKPGHSLSDSLAAVADEYATEDYKAEDYDADAAEQGAQSSGLLYNSNLLPSAVTAIKSTTTQQARAEVFDRLALSEQDPIKAADFALEGSLTNPEVAEVLLQAARRTWWLKPEYSATLADASAQLTAAKPALLTLRRAAKFRLTSNPALTQASTPASTATDRAPTEGTTSDNASIDLAQAVRDLRWQDARQISETCEPARPSAQIVLDLLLAADDGTAPEATDNKAAAARPSDRIAAATIDGLRLLLSGDHNKALGLLAKAASDHERLVDADPDDAFLLAFNPQRVGTLAAIAIGDVDGAMVLNQRAVKNETFEPAERRTFELLTAYVHLLRGDYKKALEATNEADNDGTRNDRTDIDPSSLEGSTSARGQNQSQQHPHELWTFREKLLWSCLNAGLARRSGDTDRLREAWRDAEEILLEVTPSWLYAEPLHELLVAGARLGELDRVQPTFDELKRQATNLGGDCLVGAGWLQLNLGLACDDSEKVATAAASLQKTSPTSKRSIARCAAAQMWVQIVDQSGKPQLDEEAITECAASIAEADDPWQASRLLGQAAIDEADPKAARRLLEKARDVVGEVDSGNSNTFSEWGLSNREAEVASLVGQGHTYKEVGERLFISPKTVEHHVARIRQKLGASSRAEMLTKINSGVGDGDRAEMQP